MKDIVKLLCNPSADGTIARWVGEEAADEIKSLRKDAERYRWLCDCAGRDFEAMLPLQMIGRMSEVIDAAMKESEK